VKRAKARKIGFYRAVQEMPFSFLPTAEASFGHGDEESGLGRSGSLSTLGQVQEGQICRLTNAANFRLPIQRLRRGASLLKGETLVPYTEACHNLRLCEMIVP